MITLAKPKKSPRQRILGIGPSIAADLICIVITRVEQLRGRSPLALYDGVCDASGAIHDRCLLYVFRCAVYYASTAQHELEKLKWWNWEEAPAS